jgi:hypothetical protein
MKGIRPRTIFHQALCLATISAIMLTSAQRVSAGSKVPFEASFTTEFSATVAPPFLLVTVNGEGQASHLGRTDAATTDQRISLATEHGTATYTLTGANGDTVIVRMDLDTTSPSQTAVTFEGPYVVVGGTGRFAGASGGGSVSGSASFNGPSSGVGEFTMSGTISSPGSLKK